MRCRGPEAALTVRPIPARAEARINIAAQLKRASIPPLRPVATLTQLPTIAEQGAEPDAEDRGAPEYEKGKTIGVPI